MKTLYKRVPVKYKGLIYSGFITPHDDRVSLELKIGPKHRRCSLNDAEPCKRLFEEMIEELDATGERKHLRPDLHLMELDAVFSGR